jgi:hypothetical protein
VLLLLVLLLLLLLLLQVVTDVPWSPSAAALTHCTTCMHGLHAWSAAHPIAFQTCQCCLPVLLLQVVTDVPWSPSAAAPHPLYNLHRYLGVVAIALTLLQVSGMCYLSCYICAIWWPHAMPNCWRLCRLYA